MFETMFEKFAETPLSVWITIAAILLVAAAVFVIARSKRRWSVNMLVTAAICLALSFVLSCVRLYRMPQGGSITPASMLPIFAFSYIFGLAPGLLVGLAYGMLQLMQDPFILHPAQLICDYVLPFLPLAFGALFRNAKGIPDFLRVPAGVLTGALARVFFHTVSGAVFFAEYAGDMNPWIYSIGYNMSSVGVDGLICLVIALLPPVQSFIESMRRRQSGISRSKRVSPGTRETSQTS